jgi:hypothetical protein
MEKQRVEDGRRRRVEMPSRSAFMQRRKRTIFRRLRWLVWDIVSCEGGKIPLY